MRTRVPARGRLSSSPSISSRNSASDTGRKLILSSAASLRREMTCPRAISPRRMRCRTTVYASDARLDGSADSFMGCPAFSSTNESPLVVGTPVRLQPDSYVRLKPDTTFGESESYERNLIVERIDSTQERDKWFEGQRLTT